MVTAKEIPEVLYRCELQIKFDALQVVFIPYKVLRQTKEGHWIKIQAHERWVPVKPLNRFAFIEKAAALESYYHRKCAHIRKLKAGLSLANKTMQKVISMMNTESYENTVVEELILW